MKMKRLQFTLHVASCVQALAFAFWGLFTNELLKAKPDWSMLISTQAGAAVSVIAVAMIYRRIHTRLNKREK